MKKLKIYRVINDTHKTHGMINEFVRFAWKGDEETIIAKDTKTGKLIKFDVKDLEEATAEYLIKKIEQAIIFLTGFAALIITVANALKAGHWSATIAFAIISFMCFAILKIQKDEY